MYLRQVISTLSAFPPAALIFAERIRGEFRPESAAVVLELAERELERSIRDVASERAPGLEYFLEVFLAMDMFDGLQAEGADLDAVVEKIIHYAENDA